MHGTPSMPSFRWFLQQRVLQALPKLWLLKLTDGPLAQLPWLLRL